MFRGAAYEKYQGALDLVLVNRIKLHTIKHWRSSDNQAREEFPFKKSCLSEPDASLSNNRGSQTILQTVRDWEWKWARMDTESTDSCPYRMSKEHNSSFCSRCLSAYLSAMDANLYQARRRSVC